MFAINIPDTDAGRRLDKFLIKYLDLTPKSFIYKSLRKKYIKLNGKRAEGSEVLRLGDMVSFYFSPEKMKGLRSGKTVDAADFGGAVNDARLEDYCGIVYEDENVIIADKKSGVLSQKAKAGDISLNEVLREYCEAEGQYNNETIGGKDTAGSSDAPFVIKTESGGGGDSVYKPSICNRLDRNTSGLVIFSKNYAAARAINGLLNDRKIKKYYIAAAAGHVEKGGVLKAVIKKDKKKNISEIIDNGAKTGSASSAVTVYEPAGPEVLNAAGWRADSPYGTFHGIEYTLLKVELITGKSHQIRANLAHAGFPVLGDTKYGNKNLNHILKQYAGVDSQLLHAFMLIMPETAGTSLKDLSGKAFTAVLPEKFFSIQ